MRADDDWRWQASAALVVAGLILYVPANVLPVMTMTVTGQVEPLTVWGGVMELYDSGLWPLAVIVFAASMLVPLGKMVTLLILLLTHGSENYQRERSALLRLIHKVGSWSMVDIFLLSILLAVGQLGVLASVRANPGAFFFATVMILTLVAAEIYKPRLIWQTLSSPNS